MQYVNIEQTYTVFCLFGGMGGGALTDGPSNWLSGATELGGNASARRRLHERQAQSSADRTIRD